MTIADNTTPTRSRRPSRRRAAPTRPRHRLLFPRRRATGRIRVPNADSALNFLMQERLLIAGSIVGLETEGAIDEQAPGGRCGINYPDSPEAVALELRKEILERDNRDKQNEPLVARKLIELGRGNAKIARDAAVPLMRSTS